MGEQETDFPFIGMAVFLCLSSGVINIDEDIAEILFLFLKEQIRFILDRERDDVRRSVNAAVVAVDGVDCP